MPETPRTQPIRVAAVILAAGASTRLGRPKQILPLEGRPLLQHVVDAAAGGGVDEVVVVLGHAADQVGAALSLPPNTRIVLNPRFADGQSTSLRTGIDAVGADMDAVIVLLGDEPGVSPDAIRAVALAHAAEGGSIVRANYRGRPGHPVLFAREMWPALRDAKGDRGARDIIAAHHGGVTRVNIDGEPPPDIDTWEDYARLSE